MASTVGNWLALIAAICLFVIILFSLPVRVGANDLCRGRGYLNQTDKLCVCRSPYHGAACEFKHCPFGESWWSRPLYDNQRNTELVECSNMGHCNIKTGKCECRAGYSGQACERLTCPTTLSLKAVTALNVEGIAVNDANAGTVPDTDLRNTPECSGHGQCKTIREAAAEFDGRALVRAPLDYTNWDADKIQGCVCDDGWQGFDCSQRSCPKGRDPTDAVVLDGLTKEEVFVLQCQADAGNIAILVHGMYTDAIPFDADPTILESALTSIPGVGGVRVVMPAQADGLAAMCAANQVVSTTIVFTDLEGDVPPVLLTRNTSNTRRWSTGGTELSLSGSSSAAILRMSTEHTLTCRSNCESCTGRIYFTYENDISVAVNITTDGATTAIASAIAAITKLSDAKWTNLEVEVTLQAGSLDRVCNVNEFTSISISIYSDYGNIPFLGIIDSTSFDENIRPPDELAANITLTTNAGVGEVYECSRQGICDYTSGICSCFLSFNVRDSDWNFRAVSSDGRGGLGLRGDCGHLETRVSSCFINGQSACSGHGFCANETTTCTCYEGFSGITCERKDCPLGRAWFDEPTAADTAHDYIECSGQGRCDRATGICDCREGYTGQACDIRDCVRDRVTGEACNGNGICVTTAELFEIFGKNYGNVTVDYLNPGGATWDAHRWHECLCSAHRGAGFFGDRTRRSVGPSGLVSGSVLGATPLPGWSGWDCSKMNCPKGHTNTARYGGVAVREVQRVACGMETFSNGTGDFFRLSLFGETSNKIFTHYNAADIKTAIEYPANIGNVTISFPNYATDNISVACHTHVDTEDGGFFVRFDTEFGDIPMLESDRAVNVTVTEYLKGNSTNVECGGTELGYCDRLCGNCVCNPHRGSSDGTGGAPGAAGDCSYYIPEPIDRIDAYTVFGGTTPSFTV